MKNTVEKQRKLLKKGSRRYKFGQIFLRKFIPVALCTAAAAVLGTFAVLEMASYSIDTEMKDKIRNSAENLNSSYESVKGSDSQQSFFDFKTVILSAPVEYGIDDYAAFIYDPETGEIIGDSSRNAFASVKGESDEKMSMYIIDDSALDFVNKLYDDYLEDDENTTFAWNEIYVRDGRFIPSEIIRGSIADEDAAETIKYETGDVSGWEKVTADKSRVHFFIVEGSAPDSEVYAYLKNNVENYTSFRDTTYEMDGSVFTYQVTADIDGKEYKAAAAYNINVYGYYHWYFIGAYAGLLVVSLIIAWLMAYKNYSDLKAHYAVDDYRREMTNAMAHDLKSPLMALSGYAENLRNAKSEEKRQHYTDAILQNVEYMDSIISDVLELAKTETGVLSDKTEKINLGELAEEILAKYHPALEDKKILVSCTGTADAEGDRTMLSHAVENLVSNAVKYTTPSGKIAVKINEKSLTVENDCEPMDNVNVSDLWKPFVKGDNARSGKNGSGIGLTISENIFRMHGFTMSIDYTGGKFIVNVKL